MHHRPADRAAVAHLPVADLAGDVRQQGRVRTQQRVPLQVAVAAQRADREGVPLVPDVAQLVQRTDVHDELRGGQAQLHQRHQGVSPGQQLRVVAVFGEHTEGVVHRGRTSVLQSGRDHCRTSCPEASITALTMLW